ncbi:alpha/beta hydrolase [Gordonia hydrophobica]|uniref:Alpha/beta hydrolase n=1 Tax=Gordonia hydrophobica TaxID=40516 RepID=A0ABZ2TZK8_9ACTN|nr:alpha/beta hydrolase [Gordonia hydrophobica]MBM7366283.1 alpha-beta hydrolase superfamily lysophospholipase [Gordonia hydrophobica]
MFLNALLAPIRSATAPDLVVLVLPGGTDFSYRRFSPLQGSALRMYPFTASIQARFGTRVRVKQAQYRVYGWNGGQASPMPHARAALEALADEHPGVPIAVIGHSMGGRIAAQLGDDERVTDVLALAPWWQFADWRQIHDGVRVRAVHGDADTVTRAPRTAKGIAELVARGVDADYLAIPGGGHPMLDHVGVWQGSALRFVADALERSAA